MSIFIIAEIGINHNGDINITKELIDIAKESGCDAVKFQKRDINIVYTQEFLDGLRESKWGTTQRDQKQGLEFGETEYDEINQYCKSQNIEWFASAWDLNSQKFLKKYNLKYNKIASAMNVYEDLLKEVASEKKHTFISTGLSTLDDIGRAVKIFKEANCPFELMHCVSEYPLPSEKANLKMINTLMQKFDCNVGYSGHEVGLPIAVAAAAMNITSLERHITLDRSMYGSDQSASIEPHGLKKLVQYVRVVESALGDGIKKFDEQEKKIASKLREHLKI
jgi:N-acetylneuraminate synthase